MMGAEAEKRRAAPAYPTKNPSSMPPSPSTKSAAKPTASAGRVSSRAPAAGLARAKQGDAAQ